MKPFLGINCTRDKHNEQVNGSEFLAQAVSPALAQEREKILNDTDTVEEKAKLPLGWRIVQFVTGAAAALIAIGILQALGEVSLSQGYQNAPALFWILGICLPIWGILKFLAHRKEKSTLAEGGTQQTLSQADGIVRAIYTELGVPEDAVNVDVLMFRYKEKDGQIKFTEATMQMSTCFNPMFKLYADDENFYLTNVDGRYAFPLSSIRNLQKIDKRISIPSWNKDVPYNKGVYKPYKLTVNNIGIIFCKPYYILELEFKGESWGIYFPSYEPPAFEAIAK